MEYPAVRHRAAKNITEEEAQMLYSLVYENKPVKVLELGTYGGYATTYIAKAMQNYTMTDTIALISIDYEQAMVPAVPISLQDNNASDIVMLLIVDNYPTLKQLMINHAEDADLVYIDTCHIEVEDLWESLKDVLADNAIVVFHDVLCKPSDTMRVPKLFKRLAKVYKSELLETTDNNDEKNGLGIIFFKKGKEEKPKPVVVEQPVVKVLEPVVEPEPEPKVEEVEEPKIEEEPEPTKRTKKTKKTTSRKRKTAKKAKAVEEPVEEKVEKE